MTMSKQEQHLAKAVDEFNAANDAYRVDDPESVARYRKAKQKLWTARQKWRKARVTTGTVAKPETLRVKTKKG